MKNKGVILIVISIITFTIYSCSNDDDGIIIFPESDIYGKNILHNNNFTIKEDESYSLMAVIPDGKTLTVKIHLEV